MSWSQLPTGKFTGIDWASPGATDGCDPYLVWAEADRFAGYTVKNEVRHKVAGKHKDAQPKWLPIVLELKPGNTIAGLLTVSSRQWLTVPAVYTSATAPAGLLFCTARVKGEFFRRIQPGGSLHGVVLRAEMGLPRGHQADDPTAPGPEPVALKPGELLKGKVAGLIDGGLAFANDRFLQSGKARTRFFWRQDGKGVGRTPGALGYGHELTAAHINTAMQQRIYNGMVDEGAVYEHFQLTDLRRSVNHGTHVMDLFCGARDGVDDDTSRADIVAVQLDWDTIFDSSGGSMNVHVLDGLMYILSRCAGTAKVAVNISWGTLAGPHDGSAILEAAMDQLITLKRDHLKIALPAGNSYQSRTHVNKTLSKGELVTLSWRGLPADLTQSFAEIWLPEGTTGIEIELTPPGRPALPALKWGESKMWTDGGTHPLCALIYPRTVATGRHGTCALIAVGPTFSFDEAIHTAPAGVWTIRIANRTQDAKAKPVTLDVYVERDDEVLGAYNGALQSHFEDAAYDMSGNPGSFVDHAGNPSPIRRSGNFNSISTGAKTVTVGGVRASDGSWAHYSPQRPEPDATRAKRPGVNDVPDVHEVSDDNAVLLGLLAAGTRSGATARLVGTSAASPQRARKLLNGM
jgi:hypothetical protein